MFLCKEKKLNLSQQYPSKYSIHLSVHKIKIGLPIPPSNTHWYWKTTKKTYEIVRESERRAKRNTNTLPKRKMNLQKINALKADVNDTSIIQHTTTTVPCVYITIRLCIFHHSFIAIEFSRSVIVVLFLLLNFFRCIIITPDCVCAVYRCYMYCIVYRVYDYNQQQQ